MIDNDIADHHFYLLLFCFASQKCTSDAATSLLLLLIIVHSCTSLLHKACKICASASFQLWCLTPACTMYKGFLFCFFACFSAHLQDWLLSNLKSMLDCVKPNFSIQCHIPVNNVEVVPPKQKGDPPYDILYFLLSRIVLLSIFV